MPLPNSYSPGGFIGTIVIGIVGAFICGLIAHMVGFGSVSPGFNLRSFLFAVAGSIVLLLVYRMDRHYLLFFDKEYKTISELICEITC